METLVLNAASQEMASTVRSILAIPILTDDGKSTVAVLYADSTRHNAFPLNCVKAIAVMCQHFGDEIGKIRSERIHNFPIPAQPGHDERAKRPPQPPLKVIELLEIPKAPCATGVSYLNVEFTDFVASEEIAADE